MTRTYQYPVLIIGSGAAGLTLALKLADAGIRVALICKGEMEGGSTYWAQGGIAAVLDPHDSVEAHVQDTLEAGAGICDLDAVRYTVEHSANSIDWLIDQGVPFTEQPKQDKGKSSYPYHLTKEGGHSHRRIIHAADTTGRAVSKTLTKRAITHPLIEFFEHRVAIDLITGRKMGLENPGCLGAYVLDIESDEVELFQAHKVALATGGASKVYLYTSNPDGASGDGIAMAWRAGCRVGNMEFNQFHPTCLYHPKAKSFLLSEALRGEGAKLRLPNGKRFMKRFDSRAELAPRDIVARAIDHEMKRLGCDSLFLDISHEPKDFIISHFPGIYERCLEYGFDLTREPIPIVPAAHYTCGGIVTDLHARTDVRDLYAIGECSYTGLHGANRLASNSILECIVFADAAARNMLPDLKPDTAFPELPHWDESQVTDSDEDVVISHNWDELRRFMWDYVGIVRTTKRLERAQHRADLLKQEISEYYSNYKVSNDLIELRNLVEVAELIIQSALKRKESRGLHYTLDYPDFDDIAGSTLLEPAAFNAKDWA